MMNLWLLILLLGRYSSHWATVTAAPHVTYDLSDGILKNITTTTTSVNLSNLAIKSITANLDGLANVELLDLSNNDLENLPPLMFIKLVNLKELSLANNKISSFNNTFVGLTSLKSLDVSGNPIRSLRRGDLFGLTKTVDVIVERTWISKISTGIFGAPSLPAFESIENEGTKKNRGSVPNLQLSSYPFKVCITPDSIFESIQKAEPNDGMGNCTRYTLRRYLPDTASIIDLVGRNIREFKHDWYKIEDPFYNVIDLSFNHIEDLSPELINDLPSSMVQINLSYNGITSIKNNGITNNNSMAIILRNNHICKIDDGTFDKLNLDILDLGKNKLTSTAVAGTLPTSIRKLYLDNNEISEVLLNSFHGLKNLEVLTMTRNSIENIEPGTFRDLAKLIYLELGENRIRELKPGFFHGLNKLFSCDMTVNRIENIPGNLFEGWNHPGKFHLLLRSNNIKTIENGAFSHMKIGHLNLAHNKFENDSIGVSAFNGSGISHIDLGSDSLTMFNGEWFRGVSGLQTVLLRSSLVESLGKDLAKHMKNVTRLYLVAPRLRVIKNGALFGLSTEKEVVVSLHARGLRLIQGGLFDDV